MSGPAPAPGPTLTPAVGPSVPGASPTRSPSPKRKLNLQLPPFGRLAMVQSLSSAGDAMVAVALAGSIFFNVKPGEAQSRVALTLALTVAPFAIVGPLLGPMVERATGGRKAMAVGSAAGRAVCCFFMAYWLHSLALFPVTFFTLVFSKLYLVTKAALVPGTVERPEQLVLANSKLSVGGSVAGTLAGSLGVGVLNVFGARGLLRFDMVVYLACAWAAARLTMANPAPAAVALTGVPAPEYPRPPALAPVTPPGGTGAVGAGVAGAGVAGAGVAGAGVAGAGVAGAGVAGAGVAGTGGERPLPRAIGLPPGGLQLAAVATAALRLSVGFVTFLLVFTFRRHGAALIWYGLALGASQVGNIAGALVAPSLRRRAPEEWMLTTSSVVIGTGSLVAGIVHWGTHWTVAVVLAAGIGVAAGSGKLAFDSMVQRDVPSRVRARSFARFESGFQLSWALGGLGAVLINMTLAQGFIAIGVIGLVGAAAFAGGSVKARRGTLPTWFPGAVPRPVAQPPPKAPAE